MDKCLGRPKGFRGIELSIPDVAFQKIDTSVEERASGLGTVSKETLLFGLPERRRNIDAAFEWEDFDFEYITEPEQEKNFRESLDYLAALYVFKKNEEGIPPPRDPVLIAAVFEDPETELPESVVFSSDGAVTYGFSKDFSDEQATLGHLIGLVGKNLGLSGLPVRMQTLITRHPIEERDSPELREAAREYDRKSAGKNSGIHFSFWISVVIGLLLFAFAVYYSENFFK